jgi:hypothetical protein
MTTCRDATVVLAREGVVMTEKSVLPTTGDNRGWFRVS